MGNSPACLHAPSIYMRASYFPTMSTPNKVNSIMAMCEYVLNVALGRRNIPAMAPASFDVGLNSYAPHINSAYRLSVSTCFRCSAGAIGEESRLVSTPDGSIYCRFYYRSAVLTNLLRPRSATPVETSSRPENIGAIPGGSPSGPGRRLLQPAR